ncbi:hypothetical protein EPK99_18945 [Neorhizobium lilium]|uniref:Uncharacterized protein n=1 Tax=Neorhizobium lilium TaxID=2503024 RepID=A0A444LD32_9HYPH|nr:hypothetical protein EPK99_18945 [Neorhizobium lilium]
MAESDGNWECSLLRQYPPQTGTASLFLQIRGAAHGAFSRLRIKFNLPPGEPNEQAVEDALNILQNSIRPFWSDRIFFDALRRKLGGKMDFSMLVGYYPASFKHEMSDSNRLNLIVANRPVPKVEPLRLPVAWTAMIPTGRAPKAQRGPRIGADEPKLPPP